MAALTAVSAAWEVAALVRTLVFRLNAVEERALMLVVILVLVPAAVVAVADVNRVGTGRGGGGDHWSQCSSVGGDTDAIGSDRVCNYFLPLQLASR